MLKTLKEQLIIAGPCALESQKHAQLTIARAQQLGIQHIRMNLWKPRTEAGGFEGVGEEGIPWLREAAEQGMTPSLEVMDEDEALLVVNEVLMKVPHATLLLWIGSRNQNHKDQRKIAAVVAGKPEIKLMIKNQPWRDEKHWNGIITHALSGGASIEQILLCHRGFQPWDKDSTPMRNIPDVEMALRLQQKWGIPLIMDPSHIGGSKEIVERLIEEFGQVPGVAGQIIEVHPDPDNAKTDAKQQLTWERLGQILKIKEAA